jgi:hypothetical protein
MRPAACGPAGAGCSQAMRSCSRCCWHQRRSNLLLAAPRSAARRALWR